MPFLNNLLLVSIVTEKMTVKVTPVTQIAYSQAYVCKVSPKSIEGFSYFCTLKLKYKGLCCLATPSVTSPMTCANDLANAKLLYMWLTVDSKNLFWARIFFGGVGVCRNVTETQSWKPRKNWTIHRTSKPKPVLETTYRRLNVGTIKLS